MSRPQALWLWDWCYVKHTVTDVCNWWVSNLVRYKNHPVSLSMWLCLEWAEICFLVDLRVPVVVASSELLCLYCRWPYCYAWPYLVFLLFMSKPKSLHPLCLLITFLSFFFKNMFCIVPSNGSRGKKTKNLAQAISCDLHNNLGSHSQSFHWCVKNRSFLPASSVFPSQIIYITFMGF